MYGTDRLYDTLELHGTHELFREKHENKWAVCVPDTWEVWAREVVLTKLSQIWLTDITDCGMLKCPKI